jgi:hypothetical protein
VSSFDRDLTSYVSQSVPPNGPTNTMSELTFSADNLALIVAVKGVDPTSPGFLLFFSFSNGHTKLSSTPIKVIPTGAILPFSITLVGRNGLLLTDVGSNGILTLTYSSRGGLITNSIFTPINATAVPLLCWSVYSPTIGNYYTIGGVGGIIEVNVNLKSRTNPVQIVQYYQVPSGDGGLDSTVVTIAGKDYLYVLGSLASVINDYRLNAPGHATLSTTSVVQEGDTSIFRD